MIQKLDIQNSETAQKILALQKKSYQVEAQLIGSEEIPPLKENLEQLMTCGEEFIGHYEGVVLAGSLSYKILENQLDIHRVMVHPQHFRKGIAYELISHIEKIYGASKELIVSTGALNTPAVNLYLKMNFKKFGEESVGKEIILVKFKKDPGASK